MSKIKKKSLPTGMSLLTISLFIITVSFFSYWGYQWVVYLLGKYFQVTTNSTFFDLIAGLVSMIAAVLVFIGGVKVWNLKESSLQFIAIGSIGFIIKDILNMINVIYTLNLKGVLVLQDIKGAAWDIGWIFVYIAFWVVILIYFNKESFKKTLE